MTSNPATVFVSGATGFIAQHLIELLLSKGYSVVGTVRSASKGDHLKKLLNSDSFSYEVVEDVEPVGAFDEALKKHKEVTIFLHTASPFHFKAKDIEKELLLPAINGTKNALNAIKTYGPQIKRVVVTSSYAAMMDSAKQDSSYTDTEESWNPVSWEEAKLGPSQGYCASKTFAEKAAWDFVKTENPGFIINFVNPVFVFGPQCFDSEVKDELNTSSEIINGLLNLNKDSEVPKTGGSFVDVRDVAKAHIVAFEKDISNERLMMTSGKFSGQDLLDILNENFESLRGKIPIGKPGTGKENTANTVKLDNSKTRSILGFPFIDMETSVVDSVAQILRTRAEK